MNPMPVVALVGLTPNCASSAFVVTLELPGAVLPVQFVPVRNAAPELLDHRMLAARAEGAITAPAAPQATTSDRRKIRFRTSLQRRRMFYDLFLEKMMRKQQAEKYSPVSSRVRTLRQCASFREPMPAIAAVGSSGAGQITFAKDCASRHRTLSSSRIDAGQGAQRDRSPAPATFAGRKKTFHCQASRKLPWRDQPTRVHSQDAFHRASRIGNTADRPLSLQPG